jgi:hypothetical protein
MAARLLRAVSQSFFRLKRPAFEGLAARRSEKVRPMRLQRREGHMSMTGLVRRTAVMSVLAVAFIASQGCAQVEAVGRYFQHRGEDALEMVDVGFTITTTPQLGLYWNSLDLLVFGHSEVDGYFVGWGGNQIGVTRHYNKCTGLIVSEEIVGWGDFDKDDPDTLYIRYGGLLGLASAAGDSTPDYTPACVHFFPHIGYVGLVWNARWTEILDFIVGWSMVDIGGDDGYKFGSWPWKARDPNRL